MYVIHNHEIYEIFGIMLLRRISEKIWTGILSYVIQGGEYVLESLKWIFTMLGNLLGTFLTQGPTQYLWPNMRFAPRWIIEFSEYLHTYGNKFTIWVETMIGLMCQRGPIMVVINTLHWNIDIRWTICILKWKTSWITEWNKYTQISDWKEFMKK